MPENAPLNGANPDKEKGGSKSIVSRLSQGLKGEGVGAIFSRGAASALFLKVFGAGLAFAVQVLLARLLGVTDYGIYIYAYTWAQVLVLFGRMGADKGLIRFIPEYQSQEQWGRLRGLLHFGVRTVFLACGSIAIAGAAMVWFLQDSMPASQPETLYLALAMLPILGLIQLWKGGLQAFKRITLALSPELLGKHVLIGGGAYFVYVWTGGDLTAPKTMGVTIATLAVVSGVGAFFLFRVTPDPIWQAEAREMGRYWLRITFPMMLIAGMNIIMKRTDLIMLGSILGPDAAGVYGAVVRISELAHYGLQSIDAIAAPLISELYYSKRHVELQRLITWAARGALAVASIITLSLFVFGPSILGLFGAKFEQGYVPMLILLGGQLVNSFAGVVGFVMMMTGHQNQSVRILVIAAVANVALNTALIPIFGLIGGAISTAVTMILWNVWMVQYVKAQLDLETTAIKLKT